MNPNVNVDRSEMEENNYIRIESPDTVIVIHISLDRQSVKMEDDAGNYMYFKDMQEAIALRDMLNALIAEDPPMKRR
jgi:hypothetical protein